MNILVFIHAKIALHETILEDQALIIRRGKISSIEAFQNHFDPYINVIDAGGRLVTPGLIDIQINGGFGFDFTQNPETIWAVGPQLLSMGVTSFLPTIITSPIEKIQIALETWKTGKPKNYQGAVPLGWHLEGPFLNPEKKGAHQAEFLRLPNSTKTSNWCPENGVRLVTLAPELPGQEELIKSLASKGVVVSLGHSNASAEQSEQAFFWGAKAGTHLFNAMPGLNHRQPGLTGAVLNKDEIYAGIIADGIHVDSRMVKLAYRAKGADHLILITDAMQALGKEPGKYMLAGKDVIVDNASARLQDGTLAGSILSLPDALRNIVQYTFCSLNEAIVMATETPAQLMGFTSKGSITPGKDADLVLWNQDFSVGMVVIAGEIVYDQSENKS